MWRSRRLIGAVVVISTLVLVGAVFGPSLADRLRYPRDVDAFQQYVTTYIVHPGNTHADVAWVKNHPDEVLGEGDRACAWLSGRPSAPDLDPSGASGVSHLASVYVQKAGVEAALPLTVEAHRKVVVGAWAYLCLSERHDKTAPDSEYEDED